MYMTDGYKIRPSMIRKNNHKLDNQGWLGRPASAVVVKAAQDIDFEKCRFQFCRHIPFIMIGSQFHIPEW